MQGGVAAEEDMGNPFLLSEGSVYRVAASTATAQGTMRISGGTARPFQLLAY